MALSSNKTGSENDDDDDVTKKNAKANAIGCIGCSVALNKDHIGIVCVGDHHICPQCSGNYVNTIFEDPARNIPLKCMMCKAEVITETFERQLTAQQAQTFILFNMQYDSKFLAANEVVASCPFCEYFEINTDDAGRLLFLCKKESCMKSSCVWCKKLIKQDNQSKSDDDKKYDMNQDDVESHFECAQLAPFKAKWDKALSDGNTRSCPRCGISGMKNNACTHMTCVKCRTEWCYVCGLASSELDKAKGVNNMFGHNVEWKTNAKRCPMWLDNIHEVDARWPKDDSDACVMFLHRLRTMELLKNVVKELGHKNYRAICKKYMVDLTCGFDMKEVMTADHTLIVRNAAK